MSSDKDTIVALKSAFLHTQIRILSQPLQVPERLAQRIDIQTGVLNDVLNDVNRQLRRHNQEVYFPLAIRNVAQQIDQLYWDAAAPSRVVDEDQTILRLSDDLADSEVLARLPAEWDDEEDEDRLQEYAQLHKRLRDLDGRRAELQKKLETLGQLKELLVPFRDPQGSVQPNLVTRDGPLEKELLRARSLGTRAAGRILGMETTEGRVESDIELEEESGEMDVEWDEKSKLRKLWDDR